MEGNEEKQPPDNSAEEAPSDNINKSSEIPTQPKETSENPKTPPKLLIDDVPNSNPAPSQNHPITKIIKKQTEPKIRNFVITKNPSENSNSNPAQGSNTSQQTQNHAPSNPNPNSISFLTNEVSQPPQIQKTTLHQPAQTNHSSVSALLQTTNEPTHLHNQLTTQNQQHNQSNQPQPIKVVKFNSDNKPRVNKPPPAQVSSPPYQVGTSSNHGSTTSGLSLDAMINPTNTPPSTTSNNALKTVTTKSIKTATLTGTPQISPHIITSSTTIPLLKSSLIIDEIFSANESVILRMNDDVLAIEQMS